MSRKPPAAAGSPLAINLYAAIVARMIIAAVYEY
jgi:hypothetical protein